MSYGDELEARQLTFEQAETMRLATSVEVVNAYVAGYHRAIMDLRALEAGTVEPVDTYAAWRDDRADRFVSREGDHELHRQPGKPPLAGEGT